MKLKQSRRELLALVAEGREAMSLLAAVLIDRGGLIRLDREVFQRLTPETRVEIDRDALTGNATLKVKHYADESPK